MIKETLSPSDIKSQKLAALDKIIEQEEEHVEQARKVFNDIATASSQRVNELRKNFCEEHGHSWVVESYMEDIPLMTRNYYDSSKSREQYFSYLVHCKVCSTKGLLNQGDIISTMMSLPKSYESDRLDLTPFLPELVVKEPKTKTADNPNTRVPKPKHKCLASVGLW